MAILVREMQLYYGIRALLKGVLGRIQQPVYSYSRDEYQYFFTTWGESAEKVHVYSVRSLPKQLTEPFIKDTAKEIISQIKLDRGLV